MNNNCYNLILNKYKNGIFDKSIDATYIIYLEGNKNRLNNIKKQLNNIKPTKKVYILYNKGWKKCIKDKYITNTAKDLVDCNIYIYKDANKKNYNNILILEDDYIFNEKIKKKNIINNINNFLLNKINTSFSFYFGTIPFLYIPYNFNIFKGIINIYTHSVVYSKKYRNNVLKYNYKNIYCWDIFQNYFNYNKYFYWEPLAYQKIEITENSNNWPVSNIIKYNYLKFAYFCNANNNPKYFFNITYIIAFIIMFIILLIFYNLFKYLFRKYFF